MAKIKSELKLTKERIDLAIHRLQDAYIEARLCYVSQQDIAKHIEEAESVVKHDGPPYSRMGDFWKV